MTAISDLSDLVNRLTGGNGGAPEHIFQFIDARIGSAAATNTVAGRWTSLWRYNSSRNGTTSAPSTAEIPTRTTQGALKQTNPAAGKQKWLLGVEGVCLNTNGTFVLYDRLFHMGGLSAVLTTEQTVQGDPATPALTRYNDAAGCVGNEIWLEINSQIGATSTTITVNYVNQDGVSKSAPLVAIGGTNLREPERMIPVPLASGDTGVLAVKSVQLTGSTGTAGDFGVVIAHPILTIPCQALIGFMRDLLSGFPSITEIQSDACLALAWLASSTPPPQFMLGFHFVEA